jgi:transcriptional regulator with XRE-family HTH domain
LARKEREALPAFADRIRGLIQGSHRGVVSRAAADIGIPQPTLARLVAGKVKSPRLDAIQALSAYYDISTDWLLSGVGEGPDTSGPVAQTAEWKRWESLLEGLGLSEPAFTAALLVPFAALRAWTLLTHDDAYSLKMNLDLGGEVETWIWVFQEIIDELGRDHLRAALERHVDEARLGFGDFAMHLREIGALPADLTQLWSEFLPFSWELQGNPDQAHVAPIAASPESAAARHASRMLRAERDDVGANPNSDRRSK